MIVKPSEVGPEEGAGGGGGRRRAGQGFREHGCDSHISLLVVECSPAFLRIQTLSLKFKLADKKQKSYPEPHV